MKLLEKFLAQQGVLIRDKVIDLLGKKDNKVPITYIMLYNSIQKVLATYTETEFGAVVSRYVNEITERINGMLLGIEIFNDMPLNKIQLLVKIKGLIVRKLEEKYLD